MRNVTIFSLLFFIGFFQIASAQIPNGDFEQWNNGEPVGWWTNNFAQLSLVTVTQTSDAHSGSSALKGESVSYSGGVYYSIIISGKIGEKGTPVSQRYANASGYYKLSPVDGDWFNVLVIMYKNGQGIGVGGMQYNEASTYTNFSVPIYYSNSEIPDSCQVDITLGNDTASVHVGSVFYLDDVTLNGIATSVEDISQITSYELYQNYPNPFNPATRIRYNIPAVGKQSTVSVQLKVYNVLGKEITTLVNKEQQPGNYEVEFNGSEFSSGVYLYQLKAGNYVSTKKLLLMK
ncbi:MAG: T9SS type A sorting domain-containing protein [Ignavibacteriaceae bacterium]